MKHSIIAILFITISNLSFSQKNNLSNVDTAVTKVINALKSNDAKKLIHLMVDKDSIYVFAMRHLKTTYPEEVFQSKIDSISKNTEIRSSISSKYDRVVRTNIINYEELIKRVTNSELDLSNVYYDKWELYSNNHSDEFKALPSKSLEINIHFKESEYFFAIEISNWLDKYYLDTISSLRKKE